MKVGALDCGGTVETFCLRVFSVGCFVGAVATSIVGESLGRKRSIFLGGVVMLLGALLQGLLMIQFTVKV